ncbi:hypothetical protein H4R35_007623, partial [Dimargaris xerosporica]
MAALPAAAGSAACDATSSQPMKRRVSFDLRHNQVSYLPSQQVLNNLVRAKEYLERSHGSTDPVLPTIAPERASLNGNPSLASSPLVHEPTHACLPETATAKPKSAKSASRQERTCQYWVRRAGLTLNTAITSIIVHHGQLCTTDSLSPQQRKLATLGLHAATAAVDTTSAVKPPKGVLKPQPPLRDTPTLP